MEEQKDSKVIKMNASDKKDLEQKKLTYEQLNGVCNKLYQENQYLKSQLQQASETIGLFNRLDYLFKVVALSTKQSEYHFSNDFIAACYQEIEEAMTPPAKEEEKEGD